MHGDLVNRINALFVLNTVTLQAVNLILKQDLEECRSFLDSRAEPQFAFDPITGRFPNLNALAVHFSSGPRPNEYGRCRAFLDKRIRPSEAAVQFFGKPQLVNNALAGQTTGQVVPSTINFAHTGYSQNTLTPIPKRGRAVFVS